MRRLTSPTSPAAPGGNGGGSCRRIGRSRRAFLILAVLNLIPLARLIIGEIEPAHVRALRKPGPFIDVEYAEDKLPIRDFRLRRWVSRLKWSSRYEVKSLALGPDLNDRDLCRLSAAIFPMWWN